MKTAERSTAARANADILIEPHGDIFKESRQTSARPLTLFRRLVNIPPMGVPNRFNGITFSTAVSILTLVSAFAADPDTDGDGLTDLEETAPGQFEIIADEVTWLEAKAAATSRGGYLATITSTNEWDRLVPLLIASGKPNFWLGASDEKIESDWRWVTGEPFTFSLWNFGEPNNCCGGEHFLAITPSFWNDAGSRTNPDSRASYVIERGLNSDPTKSDTDDDGLNDYDEVKLHRTFPYLADSDDDLFSDAAEIAAASNPLDPNSIPPDHLNVFLAIEVEFFTAAGTRYQLESTSNLLTWVPVGEPIQGNGQIHRQFLSARHGVRLFYRLQKLP